MVSWMRWGKAISLGLKFFLLSMAFTLLGIFLLASAISINMTTNGLGTYVISIDTSNAFKSIGTFTLLAIGLMIIVVGNSALFFKLISEALSEADKDYLW